MGKKHRRAHAFPAEKAGAPPVSPVPPEPAPAWQRWLPLLAIFLLAVLVHSPARSAAYIWDDQEYLLGNNAVKRWNGFAELWAPGNTSLYVPMVTSSLWLEHKIWGLGSVGADGVLRGTGYHIDSILIHAASAAILFVILRRLRLPGGAGAAWLAAAIFAVHPVTVESVAWLSERKNNLCGLFFFSSLYFSCHAWGLFPDAVRKRRHYALALFFFVAALLSKIAAGFLPAALLVLLWWKHGHVTRRQWLMALPMIAIVVAFGGLVAHLEHAQGGTQGALWDFSLGQRIVIAGNAFWFQLGKLLWPYPIVEVYPRFAIDAGKPITDVTLYLAPLAYGMLLAVCLAARRWIGRAPLAVVLIYTAALFPTLGFVSFYTMIYTFVADHYQYLAAPVVIVCVVEVAAWAMRALTGLIASGKKSAPAERLAMLCRVGLSAAVLIPLASITFGVSHLYASPLTLWEYAYAHNPESPVVLESLASALMDVKPLDFATVKALGDKAIALEPDNWRGYAAQSEIYKAMGLIPQSAQAQHEAEVRMPPWELSRRNDYLQKNAGVVTLSPEMQRGRDLEAAGKWDDAIALYQAMLQRNAADDEAALRLGYAYQTGKSDLARAVETYRGILARHPENADAWFFLGIALRQQHQDSEAQTALEKARQLGGDAVLWRHPELLQPAK